MSPKKSEPVFAPPPGRSWDVLSRTCPSRESLARIANKWTAMIVALLGERTMRFGEIRSAIDGISPKVLTETLRELERDGLVERRAFAEIPPRVEYHLTPLGLTLQQPLAVLCSWAELHIAEVLGNRHRFDRDRAAADLG